MKAANVRSITELKSRTKELVQEVADGGQPVVITQTPRIEIHAVLDGRRTLEALLLERILAS